MKWTELHAVCERYYTNFKINFYQLSLLFLLNKPKKSEWKISFIIECIIKKQQQQNNDIHKAKQPKHN